ncbi:hypothetical protein ARSEF4850_010118 [Beauveria asiatica]
MAMIAVAAPPTSPAFRSDRWNARSSEYSLFPLQAPTAEDVHTQITSLKAGLLCRLNDIISW